MDKMNRTVGGILLVAGTTIGAAVLALPVTAVAGFFPSQLLMTSCWLLLTYTAFLFLEVTLWFPKGANMITMARYTLGPIGQYIALILYLFLLYSLLTAYIALSGDLFLEMTASLNSTLPRWLGFIPLFGLFSIFVYRGTESVDLFNRLLMVAMFFAYLWLLYLAAPFVEKNLLARRDWSCFLVGISVVITSFGFHIIIPTLTLYLDRDIATLKRVIFIGSLLPFLIYSLWQLIALGIIPQEALLRGYLEGVDGATLLTQIVENPTIYLTARLFMWLAVFTSFLGVSLSLWDCLCDGVGQCKQKRPLLYLITFAPPLLFALFSRRVFLSALEYAGAFGVITLLAILPVCMVWSGRYHLTLASDFQTFGGKRALVLVVILSCLIIAAELLSKLTIFQMGFF